MLSHNEIVLADRACTFRLIDIRKGLMATIAMEKTPSVAYNVSVLENGALGAVYFYKCTDRDIIENFKLHICVGRI